MKITRAFVNRDHLVQALSGERKLNLPVGYAYCEEEEGLSCSVFLSTDRETQEIKLTKSGDLCFNIKTTSARKKGDHVASEAPEVPVEAQGAEIAPEDVVPV